MTHAELRARIPVLLTETGRAHHQAFLATDGEDPEWPLWYAGFLQQPLGALLEVPFTRSQLVYCLMFAEYERGARDPDVAWQNYYAEHLIDRYAPAELPETDALALYHFPMCPFCMMVRRTVDKLGIAVELRDIHADTEHRKALIAARGRATVPVLRIASPGGEERWMPESRDIIRYLKTTYG